MSKILQVEAQSSLISKLESEISQAEMQTKNSYQVDSMK